MNSQKVEFQELQEQQKDKNEVLIRILQDTNFKIESID